MERAAPSPRPPERAPAPTAAPATARGALIDPGLVQEVGDRIGFDVRRVRIVSDAASDAENRRLGALARADGDTVHVAGGAHAARSARGRALIAHELTHVAQQLSGRTDDEDVLEREALDVEAGGALSASRWAGTGAPRIGVHLRRGDVLSIRLDPHPDGTASLTAELEGGGTSTASGTAQGIGAGDYWVSIRPGRLSISHDDGTPLDPMTFFTVPWSTANAAFLRAVSRRADRVRLVVTAVAAPAAAGGGGGTGTGPGGGGTTDPYADDRRRIAALPDRIKAVLFSSSADATPTAPEDLAVLLRIAEKLGDLTDEELADYGERTTSSTSDVHAFEDSIDQWITQVRARRERATESDNATAALFGMDAVYQMYRSWLTGLLMGDPPSWIADWEALPVEQLPADREGFMNQLYLRLRRALAPYGYGSLHAFQTAITRFLVAFRASALDTAARLLDRYQHALVTERDRYTAGAAGAASLSADLGPARVEAAAAQQVHDDAQALSGSWDPDDINAYYAAGAQFQQHQANARSAARGLSDVNPLLGYANAPLLELAETTDAAGVTSVLSAYVTSSLDKVRRTRERLASEPEVVYRLDNLMAATKTELGIQEGSIWASIIADHTAPTLEDIEKQMFLAVLGLALAIGSGGSALIAGAAVGFSAAMALQTYEEYALERDAYGAQLLAEEPSLGWVVLAVAAVVVDLAAVAAVIRPIRPALQAFQRTGDIAQLEAELVGVEERIRRSIMQRAELELRARGGWDAIWARVVPPGATRASLFGADLLAEQLGRLVYSIQLNLRRGINTFAKWRLSREAADLVGDMGALSPAAIARVRAAYSQGIEATQRIASAGRRLGLSAQEVDGAIQAWATRGTGTVDDVIAEMEALRAARPAGTAGEWTPPRGWNGPANHGEWRGGTRGNAGWIDDRPEVIRIVGRDAAGEVNPIMFRQGEVDFSTWSRGELNVPGLVGDHAQDMVKIRLAIAERQGLAVGGSRTARSDAALEWLRTTDDGYGGVGLRPHHAGGNRIQLVPKDLHKVQHTDIVIYDLD